MLWALEVFLVSKNLTLPSHSMILTGLRRVGGDEKVSFEDSFTQKLDTHFKLGNSPRLTEPHHLNSFSWASRGGSLLFIPLVRCAQPDRCYKPKNQVCESVSGADRWGGDRSRQFELKN